MKSCVEVMKNRRRLEVVGGGGATRYRGRNLDVLHVKKHAFLVSLMSVLRLGRCNWRVSSLKYEHTAQANIGLSGLF